VHAPPHFFELRRAYNIRALELESSAYSLRLENVLDTLHVKDIDVLHASDDELLV
jgi:hypothetical protein